eukprot:CAMPEP_0185734394 /NCGR_PEP_ID=MMETSP1171-20130828/22360_1 /TAXON_ID=374046 /ORGANISM="Helicotheca tamensis, Strain CCMP826" /LENGTH=559 /DNA_ID=CAMNT_0028404381 /DNA_START=36 /DNA_END=1716 /DNA_ORIENTATION=+
MGDIDGEKPKKKSSTALKRIKRKGSRRSKKKKSRNPSRSIDSQTVGVFLAVIILGVYLFGLVQNIRALPDIKSSDNLLHTLGERLGHNIILSKQGVLGDDTGENIAAERNSGEVDVKKDVTPEVLKNNNNNGHHLRGVVEETKKVGTVTIPKAKWPVSIRDEVGDEEEIKHPADPAIKMTAPKFWSDPVHDNKLMTREQAMQIGSCEVPDSNGSFSRGDDCPLDERTIFVSIASYRDWQCRYTVESIFTRAKNPKRVRVAVVDQIVDGDDHCDVAIDSCEKHPYQALCMYKDQVDVYQMDAPLAVGPVFARHFGHRLYRGEYYAMQSDAHVTFTQNWDEDIILQQEATKDEMAVLSTYLTDIVGSIDERTGESRRKTRPIMCNTDYEGGPQGMHLRHLSQPEGIPTIHGTPQLQPYWAAGFSFSRGHFVVNVPYDFYQPMIFQGEEMSIGIRGFTIGYDYYAPERSVCFHTYAEGPNKNKRATVKHFWENADKYAGTGKKAMARLLGIVGMNPEVPRSQWDHTEEDRYGLGKVRDVTKFYETFGIDVVNKKKNIIFVNL